MSKLPKKSKIKKPCTPIFDRARVRQAQIGSGRFR